MSKEIHNPVDTRFRDYQRYRIFCKNNGILPKVLEDNFYRQWDSFIQMLKSREEKPVSQQKPNAKGAQVGGDHYNRHGDFQHWDVVAHFNLNYFEGQITRYVFRCREKGGIEDLRKARHYIDKYIAILAADSKDDGSEPQGKGYVDQD